MVAICHAIEQCGYSVSIRPSKWGGSLRAVEPLPIYGPYVERNHGDMDLHGYLAVCDEYGFELVISDTTGGLPSIASVIVDGAEIFRTYFHGRPHTVVVEGYPLTSSLVLPLMFKRRNPKHYPLMTRKDIFGLISVVFREPLSQYPYYQSGRGTMTIPVRSSRQYKVIKYSPARTVRWDMRTARSGRLDVEPLATINIRYAAVQVLVRDILPNLVNKEENVNQGKKRALDAPTLPPPKHRRMVHVEEPVVAPEPEKPSKFERAARELAERYVYPQGVFLHRDSEKRKKLHLLLKNRIYTWWNPSFKASPLRKEL